MQQDAGEAQPNNACASGRMVSMRAIFVAFCLCVVTLPAAAQHSWNFHSLHFTFVGVNVADCRVRLLGARHNGNTLEGIRLWFENLGPRQARIGGDVELQGMTQRKTGQFFALLAADGRIAVPTITPFGGPLAPTDLVVTVTFCEVSS